MVVVGVVDGIYMTALFRQAQLQSFRGERSDFVTVWPILFQVPRIIISPY